ncbi:hypothetical protein NQ317_019811 [Molorchus minor]|uniref:C2H2-type domain-containing protein n=1 Tax=Molorchus minor TaxID=1323400 RepID=A0ABQ9ISX9_9CUCU|nr:hypothetical protein NQ317_019811 [Molorchus minor]
MDEYSASLTNRQNSEGIESSATNSAGLISAVRGHQEQSRKLPLKIITDTGEKVINPFAIKQIQANERESDSSSTEDDLYKPNPSKPPNEKVAVSSEVPNTINDDSDIELIEDNPSIIVLNDTQNTTNTQWFSKSQSKRSLAKKNIPSDLDYESDDSEVVASLPKRRKSPIESEFGPSPIKPSPNQSSENKADQNLSESSQSPELLTPFGNKEVAGAIISKLKEENSNSCTDSEFMEQSYESLAQFCVICRQYKKNLGHHVKRFHSVSLKMSFTCKTCSKMFYMKHTLDVHKCKSNKE